MTDLPTDPSTELLTEADVAICGAGPIGAATAYFLARPDLRVVLIDHDPVDDPAHAATFRVSPM